MNTERTIKNLRFLEAANPRSISRVKQLVMKFGGNIQSLELGCKFELSDLVELLKQVPNVESLIIESANNVDKADSKSVVKLDRLKSLSIVGNENSAKLMKLVEIDAGKLTKFSLVKRERDYEMLAIPVGFANLEIPSNYFTNCILEELNLNIPIISEKKKFLSFFKSQKNIKKLQINMATISNDDFEQILTAMINLEVLDIFDIRKRLTDLGFKNIFKLPKLKELSLRLKNEPITVNTIKLLIETFENKVMPTVERFYLHVTKKDIGTISYESIQVKIKLKFKLIKV